MPPPTLPAAQPDRSGARDDAHLIGLWLAGCSSAHTQRAYARDVAACRAWTGERPLPALTLADLQEWRAQLLTQGQAASSINRRLAAVRSLLTFGQRTGYLHFNVGAALRPLPQADRLAERILPEGDTLNLIHAAGAPTPQGRRNQALLQFLYYTGARVAEACGVQWRDLQNLAGNRPVVAIHGKGGRTRHVALPVDCARAVAQLQPDVPDPEGPVFRTRSGRALLPRAAGQIVRAAAVRAGLSAAVSPHWLRHAHASHALDRGAAVHVVQHTLGHAARATTTRYVHVQPGESSGHSLTRLSSCARGLVALQQVSVTQTHAGCDAVQPCADRIYVPQVPCHHRFA